MRLDLTGLAAEKITRSEAINLMLHEAKQASAERSRALESERVLLSNLSPEDARRMVSLACVTIEGGYHHAEVRKKPSGTFGAAVNISLPRDLSDLPPDLCARFNRLERVEADLNAERLVSRSLEDRSHVQTVLLRGMLGETEEGKALLKQLGEAAEKFRETVRGRNEKLLDH